jgi:hypothetical protein
MSKAHFASLASKALKLGSFEPEKKKFSKLIYIKEKYA